MSIDGLRRARAPRGSGDRLRDEILDAATELLLETGHARSVSIRSVAKRVGVTPPSIYLHFADKDALMDAVCAGYFEKLDPEMRRLAAEHASPVKVLRAQGLAYVRFATQTPELYRIATMGEWRSGRTGSDTSDRDRGVLRRDLRCRGDRAPRRVRRRGRDPDRGGRRRTRPGAVRRVLSAVFCGQRVLGYCGADATPEKLASWVAAHRPPQDPRI